MKHLLTLTVLTISLALCFASPIISYDPNSVTVSPDNVTIAITIEITKEQYEAMQELDISLIDLIKESGIGIRLDRYIEKAKVLLIKDITIKELKAKIEK